MGFNGGWLLIPPVERCKSHRPCTTSKCQLASGATNSAEPTGHASLFLSNDNQMDHCGLHQKSSSGQLQEGSPECLIRFKVVEYPIKHFIVVPIQHQFLSFLWVFRRDGILQVSKNQGKVWVSMLLCLHARSCPCPLTVVGGTLVGRLPPCQSHQLG